MMDGRHGGDIRQYLENGKDILDFSASINPLGLSARAKAALAKEISRIVHYPQARSESLKNTLAGLHNIRYDNIALGNGSMELVYDIPRAFAAKKVLVITPTFSEYEFAAKSSGARILFHNTSEGKDFKIDVSRVSAAASKVDIIFICNPNNPTGSYLTRSECELLADRCAKYGAVLVLDEVFMDFVEGGDELTMLPGTLKNKNTLVLRSMTKFFAMPGLRLGYCLGHRELIKKIRDIQYPWNINSMAQAAGEAVIRDRSYITRSRSCVFSQRQFLFGELNRIKGLKTFKPASNFILCKLDRCAIKSAKALNKRLIKKRIIVRDCGNFRGLDSRFFRVAVRARAENIKLIAALKEVL